jgi:hypothetical protein
MTSSSSPSSLPPSKQPTPQPTTPPTPPPRSLHKFRKRVKNVVTSKGIQVGLECK